MRYFFALAAVWTFFAASQPLEIQAQQALIISEFMANNTRGLSDEDGEFSDWIEIHNRGTAAVNLGGWFLTDNSANLTQWQFPATNLPPGGYLVVFASNKDRRTAGATLHTNFRLSQDGEYLGLVKPDGITVASDFAPRFPPQVPNVSYGRGVIITNSTLLTASSPLRVLIPTTQNGGNALGDAWKSNSVSEPFNDASWRVGQFGIGFDTGANADLVGLTNLVARYNFDAAPQADIIINSSSLGATHNGSNRGPVWRAASSDNAQPSVTRFGAMEFFALTNHQIVIPAHTNFNLVSGTISFWMRSSGIIGAGGQGAMLFDRLAGSGLIIVQRDDGHIYVQASTNSNILVSEGIVADDRWHHIAVVFSQVASQSISLYIDGLLSATGPNRTAWSWPATTQLEIGRSHTTLWRRFNGSMDDFRIYNAALSNDAIGAIYAGDGGVEPQEIATDVRDAMLNISSSAFIRAPFTIADTNKVSFLELRLKYDDGFVAWINGQEVGRANAPETVDWNSAATGRHSSATGLELLLGTPPGLLRNGTNILAIQGLNRAASDPTFLISAGLGATHVSDETDASLYFTRATPNEANLVGVQTPGPIVLEATHSPNVPQENDDLLVLARVAPSFNAVASVTMRYRIMFGAEVTVPMLDDGQHQDGAAGDGVYAAIIPASTSTNNQMIRYYISTADVNGVASRWPLFLDRLKSAEFLGTVVSPDTVTSKLPIYHFFVASTEMSRVDSQAGGRASVYHEGEFYDNVQMQLRGNSTSTYNKKSHRVEFNREHPLRHSAGGPPLRKTSFVADYPDPTYMRQGLAYWLCDLIGAPAPFYQPVRLQLNGAFYQIANHNDVHGDELLKRLGFDPNGALYNAAGQVTPGKASTGGFEKKTREWETGDPDYILFSNAIREGLAVGARMTNAFDMIDLPEVVNYMAAARFVHENDDVWANMSLYHDNDGDDLWRIIPFDMNLSWGAAFLDSGAGGVEDRIQNTNDTHKSFPMYGSGAALAATSGNYNRMYDIIFRVPQTREMFLRRLRTMLDLYVLPPGTPPLASPSEQKIIAWRDLIAEEAARDRARWQWPAKGGQSNFDPGMLLFPGVEQMIEQFFHERRNHFYIKHSALNTSLPIGINKNQNAGIPVAQPADVVLRIAQIEANPASGNQGHEFICLTNPQPFAIDISGWKLEGAVDFAFAPGTVVTSNSVVYVTPSLIAFKTRSTPPKRGMGLFVVGNYQGQLSARGETLRVWDEKGRLVDTHTFAGSPSAAQQSLRVSEIMYNPALGANSDELEFIELANIGQTSLDLSGVHFSSGIDFVFPTVSSLGAGQFGVVVRNQAAFSAKYPGIPILGQFVGALDNGGERLTLRDASGEVILDFVYNNNWYPITDGHGFSLTAGSLVAPLADWDAKGQWRASDKLNGSPAADDPVSFLFPQVWVNELLSNGADAARDAVELYNASSNVANISGWFLSDDFANPKKYRFPANSTIEAGRFMVVSESVFNANPNDPNSFAFDTDEDEVYLFSADAAGNLTGYLRGFRFGSAEPGVSFGRLATSEGKEVFVPQQSITLGQSNSGLKSGPVIINEIHYHPSGLAAGAGAVEENRVEEFIELRNITSAAVTLFDPSRPTNTWRLQGGADFVFPANVTLPAGGLALLVNFDPAANPSLAAAFRGKFNVPASIPLFGPISGSLANEGERLRLTKPNIPSLAGVSWIIVDEVEYGDSLPWPEIADGLGASLQRLETAGYGGDPANWRASLPTPGAALTTGSVPVIAQQPASATARALSAASLSVQASGPGPIGYQWSKNGVAIPGATSATLSFPLLQFSDSGRYAVSVMNPAGAVVSSNAFLSVNQSSYFAAQPVTRNVLGGTNVTITVTGFGAGNRQYAWLRNGEPIAGATGAALTLSNVRLEDSGFYSARVTDDNGVTVSGFSELNVVERPVITQQPRDTTALEGEDVDLTVSASGTTPMYFRWRRGTTLLTNLFSQTGQSVFTLRNVTMAQAGIYNVLITNIAVSLGSAATMTATSSNAVLTVLADFDRDGMADEWEVQNGFSTNNAADATLDFDNDGVSNRDEYRARTDPKDPSSGGLLRLSFEFQRPSQLRLSFQAAPNRTYAIQSRDAVVGGNWAMAQSFAAGAARTESLTTNLPSNMRFFRIISPAP